MLPKLQRVAQDRPYRVEAYEFVMRALDFTLSNLDELRHVSGGELVDGIRLFARQEFGPLAKHVLNQWGVYSTRDFGEIVFDLVAQGVLAKTDEDRIEDFDDRFDFRSEFELFYYRDHPLAGR
jgi:uncharacterized repeat protein (TIGR04138 family)